MASEPRKPGYYWATAKDTPLSPRRILMVHDIGGRLWAKEFGGITFMMEYYTDWSHRIIDPGPAAGTYSCGCPIHSEMVTHNFCPKHHALRPGKIVNGMFIAEPTI